jgi:hypothetical protein
MDMVRSHVMVSAPVTGWIRFFPLPLGKAWTKRSATGIKPMAIIVLARGAVVMVSALHLYGELRLLISLMVL